MLNSAFLEGLLFEAVFFSFLLFPFLYILLRKGKNRFLYCSASFGATLLVIALLYVIALPFAIIAVKVTPQLAQYGVLTYVLPLLHLQEFVQRYFLFLVYPSLNIVLPILIYRRYSMFRKESKI